MIPPTTRVARSQDRYESEVDEGGSVERNTYRRRRGFWAGTWDSYWEYQKLKWSLAGFGLALAGVYLLFNPALFLAGLFLIAVGAGWTYIFLYRSRD